MTQQLSITGSAPRNECIFSPCPACGSVPRCGCGAKRVYRYLLKRRVSGAPGICLFALANPSVADDFDLDPSLTRCANYTLAWGFGSMWVVNVRAWISTDPRGVPSDPLAIGPDNASTVAFAVGMADLVVCGYGELGGALGDELLSMVRKAGKVPHALKLTKAGRPGHPLYLAKSLKPFPMEAS